MKLIGLTGGIASGKSAVARLLRDRGVPVIDADQLARDVVAPGTPGLAAVIDRFGAEMLAADGTLDRKKLGAVVFSDRAARADLNALTHPLVAALAIEKLEALRASGAPVAVYEVPLLFENDLEGMMDATLLVAAPVDVQRERLMKRDNVDAAAADARIAVQLPLEEKRKRATAVLENTGSLADLQQALDALWPRLAG